MLAKELCAGVKIRIDDDESMMVTGVVVATDMHDGAFQELLTLPWIVNDLCGHGSLDFGVCASVVPSADKFIDNGTAWNIDLLYKSGMLTVVFSGEHANDAMSSN